MKYSSFTFERSDPIEIISFLNHCFLDIGIIGDWTTFHTRHQSYQAAKYEPKEAVELAICTHTFYLSRF